jgi:cytochrome c6
VTKTRVLLALFAVIMTTGCSPQTSRDQSGPSGEFLFHRHCAGCHPDGKNIIYPAKDLRQMTLAANGISRQEDIMAVMRNPGKGMPRFDRTVIPDDEAGRIALYIMKTYR